jgi:hypothetical protein
MGGRKNPANDEDFHLTFSINTTLLRIADGIILNGTLWVKKNRNYII